VLGDLQPAPGRIVTIASKPLTRPEATAGAAFVSPEQVSRLPGSHGETELQLPAVVQLRRSTVAATNAGEVGDG